MISTDLRKFAGYLEAIDFKLSAENGAWTLVNINGKMLFNGSFMDCYCTEGEDEPLKLFLELILSWERGVIYINSLKRLRVKDGRACTPLKERLKNSWRSKGFR